MRHPNETIDREAYERYQTHLRRMFLAKAKAKKPVKKFVDVLIADNVDELQGCCGIQVLSDLGTEQYQILSAKEYQKEVDADYYGEAPEGMTTATGARSLGVSLDTDQAAIATTVPRQKKEIAALQEKGFVSLKSFKNPGTGNTVTIWYRKPSA